MDEKDNGHVYEFHKIFIDVEKQNPQQLEDICNNCGFTLDRCGGCYMEQYHIKK